MTFDWTTFFLEILNFLVLVWILKRFLYAPVLAALDVRQQRLKGEAAKAETLQREASELKAGYEQRLADWDRERERQHRQLEEELTKARAAGMEDLKKSLADAEAKAGARAEALAVSRDAALLRQATGEAYAAATAMLVRLASSELTARIAAMFVEDLASLPEEDVGSLRRAATAQEAGAQADVASAHVLDAATRERIAQALAQAAGKTLPVGFREAPELLAGLRVSVGECLLHANLADELAFFRRQGGHG